MIDHRCQGRGYGRLAMQAVIDFVRTLPNARQLYLSHLKGNDAMARFSQQLGFRYTGEEIVPGDLLMVLEIA